MSLARFVPVFGAAAVFVAAPAAAHDAQFCAAIVARVAAERLTLCRWDTVDLDGDGSPERFAWVREPQQEAKAAQRLPHVWLVPRSGRCCSLGRRK